MSKGNDPLKLWELDAAKSVTAQQVAESLGPGVPGSERLHCLGNYLICCGLANGPSVDELADSFTDGLLKNGVSTEQTEKIRDFCFDIKFREITFSLGYLERRGNVPGIVATRTAVAMDTALFIRGILEQAEVLDEAN